MSEREIRATLVDVLREGLRGFQVLRHEDRWKSGHPDITIWGNRIVSAWETKHADPTFEKDEDQKIMMVRLNRASYARYIVWEERDKPILRLRTYIVEPRSIHEWPSSNQYRAGFDHQWVLEAVRKVHSYHDPLRP